MNHSTSAHIIHTVPLQQVCSKITLKKTCLKLEQYCYLFAEPIDPLNTTDNPTTNNSVDPTAVIVAIVFVLLAFLVLLVAATFAFYLYRHGKISSFHCNVVTMSL